MDKVASQAVDLTGDWELDRRVSDDVRARLLPIIERQERRWRKLERPFEDESSTSRPGGEPSAADMPRAGTGEPSTMQWIRQMRRSEAEALIAFVAPATRLQIRQSMRQGRQEISVHTDKGEGTRILVPGEASALFVGMGSFELSSGWQKTRFVVDMRGTGDNSMHIVQYYSLLETGAQLEMRMEAYLPELGKQVFRFVFKRSLQQ
jgi:hypothetical protein